MRKILLISMLIGIVATMLSVFLMVKAYNAPPINENVDFALNQQILYTTDHTETIYINVLDFYGTNGFDVSKDSIFTKIDFNAEYDNMEILANMQIHNIKTGEYSYLKNISGFTKPYEGANKNMLIGCVTLQPGSYEIIITPANFALQTTIHFQIYHPVIESHPDHFLAASIVFGLITILLVVLFYATKSSLEPDVYYNPNNQEKDIFDYNSSDVFEQYDNNYNDDSKY